MLAECHRRDHRQTILAAGWWCVTLVALGCGGGCHALRHRPETLGDEPLAGLPLGDRLQPSHDRDWSPDMAVLPYAEIGDDQVTVHNIRDCVYRSDSEYVIKHYDATYDLRRIREVDFIVVPFNEAPSLAHTMLSFGFAEDRYLTVSVEARLERGETYSPALGAMRQFELIYLLADERDVILRRTKHRGAEVYLYRTRATPEQARTLFLDVMNRVNQIYQTPEFYDTLTNNCTTNLVQHVNRIRKHPVSLYDPRVLLPGYADQLAYELGLLDPQKSFAQLREEARVRDVANRNANRLDFSARIRR